MANFKVEISKRFGVFSASFFSSDEGKAPADDTTYKNIDDVIKFVRDEFLDAVDEEDSVIFRGIAYNNLSDLEREIRRAPY